MCYCGLQSRALISLHPQLIAFLTFAGDNRTSACAMSRNTRETINQCGQNIRPEKECVSEVLYINRYACETSAAAAAAAASINQSINQSIKINQRILI